jgi:putative transposase
MEFTGVLSCPSGRDFAGPDTGWLSVDCLTPGLDGVSVEHWMRAARILRQKNADMAKVTDPIVQQALHDIEEFSRTATKRVGIDSSLLTASDMQKFDREVVRNFDFVRGDEDGPDVLERSSSDESPSDQIQVKPGPITEMRA